MEPYGKSLGPVCPLSAGIPHPVLFISVEVLISLFAEVCPNMDVLIFIGGTAAFVYSILGLLLEEPNYLFFETAATIFTLVLLGNWMEHRAVKQTTTAIEELTALQPRKSIAHQA